MTGGGGEATFDPRPDAVLEPRFLLAVSAASGLVVVDGVAHVVSDDGLQLHRHRLADGLALPPLPLAPGAPDGALPKATKPDLEALLDAGDGTLLAIGSGSGELDNRQSAFRVALATGAVRALDLRPLYAALRTRIGALDIEGAILVGDRVVLANRRAGGQTTNTLIGLDAAVCLHPDAVAWDAAAIRSIVAVELPRLEGIPLGFTDLAWHPRLGLHFLAAAEDTDDPVLDGRCMGSVVGRLDAASRVSALIRLRPDHKLEGLAFDGRWWCVADADDPASRSPLFGFQASVRDGW